jgi:pilus assembly protein CpaD
MSHQKSPDRRQALRRLCALIGVSASLGACTYTGTEVVTASVPEDYRLRHPIAVEETNRSVVLFVGHGRGGLSASQRTDVMGLAQIWVREGTGAIVADVPVDTPNARAAAATFRDVKNLLVAGGVPPNGIAMRPYHPDDPGTFPPIRLNYPKIAAVAGPCGLWPDDLGPTILDRGYNNNSSYYNFGCASQRNLAAMVDNPADLVQPRPESTAYTARRTAGFEKYRKGEASSTSYPDADKAKLSDTGK